MAVVWLTENLDSFSGVADAGSITVERLPEIVFVIHISGIFAESWSWSSRQLILQFRSSLSLCSRVDSENVSDCVVPSRSDQEGTMYQCLCEDHSGIHSHIVSCENPYLVSDRQSILRSLWEKVLPSSWRNHRLADTKWDIRVAIRGVIRDYFSRWSNV